MAILAALCAIGAEKILGNEIKKLGYTICGNAPGRVTYQCPEEGLFRSNLCLRTADRVYLQAASFSAPDFDALFDGVYAVCWQDYVKKDVRIVVDKVRIFRSALTSEHSVQSIVHKAIYKKLGDAWHISVLPESGEEAAVRVYLERDTVQILLDLSGEPLHKRGYRVDGGPAPMRETLAAAMLQLCCWRRKTPLHDPFCGSGTILCEAALFAYNVAPGLGRRFSMEHLAFFNQKEAEEIRRKEAEKIRPDAVARITGTDADPAAAERARKNAEHACVIAGRALQLVGSDARIQRPDFAAARFSDIAAPYETGLILSNPPYGERLGDAAQAEELYKNMGVLFDAFPGWEMGFICAHKNFEDALGKTAVLCKDLKSGNLDTRFYLYKNI